MFEIAMLLHRATPSDAPRIAELVNAAFCGESAGAKGWTHEDGFFHGDRIDAAEILDLLAVPGAQLLLWIADREISGCAYVKPLDDAAYLGLLAVRPGLQDCGVGSAIVAECERVARAELKARAMRISVITSHRPELTTFYERRGYVRTGRFTAFQRKQAQRTPSRLRGMSSNGCRSISTERTHMAATPIGSDIAIFQAAGVRHQQPVLIASPSIGRSIQAALLLQERSYSRILVIAE